MFRASTLLLALAVTAPLVWGAFGTGSVSVTSFLVHYLVAVLVVGALLGLLRHAMRAPPGPGPRHQDDSAP